MKQLVYFLMVSLAFTALQVATVEAQSVDPTTVVPPTGAPGAPPGDDPCMGKTGDALITCVEENPPPSGTSEAGAPPTLTLNDPRCQLAEADRDPGCPPMASMTGDDTGMAPPTGEPGAPPMGDAAAKPSLGERVKSFFGMGTEDATPPAGDPGMPPMGDPTMAPPTGAPGEPPMGEDCAGKPTPGEVAACWDRLNNPTPGTPPAGQ